jgi:hypothetical protein
MTNDGRDEVKYRELIAKRLEEIADQNEKDGSHDAPLPAWIAGIRDAAGFVKDERFTKDEAAEHAENCKDCPRCKHPDCRHSEGLCNYARDCGCDYYIKCECGHPLGAHFDGNMERQACLYEGCECVKCFMVKKTPVPKTEGRYDNLTPVPIPNIPPVEIACVLNAVSSNGIVHLECEIKDRPLDEALEIQIRLSELESVYRYLIGGLDDEGDDGNPIIRPMTGFDVWDIARSKVSPSCKKCGHTEAMHVNDGLGCMDVSKDAEPDIDAFPRCHCPKFVTMGEQSEKLYDASDLAKSRDDLAERFKLYREATKAEQSEQAKSKFCIHCGHYLFCHYGERNPNGCTCSDFTTVSQFSSCSQSVQPEHSSQSQEPQLPDRFQDKSQRVRIAGVRLVRRENTLKSDLPVRLDLERALSYLSWLAQLTSLVTECQACRKLAVPGLNNLLLELKNSHPTHMEHPNSASPTE